MQLGEIIATYDLGQALRGESGKFEVTSPAGEIYHVTCRSDHSISNLEWAGARTGSQPLLIRKITEIVSASQGNGAVGGMTDGRTTDAGMKATSSGSPFLIENTGNQTGISDMDSVIPLRQTSRDEFSNSETATLDLFCIENEQSSQQPSVWVCLRTRADRTMNADQLLTAPCTNINELDSEIRRLQAQLDEIRSRARKKLFSAQAAAVSA
jgi:hypothetical protein